MLHKRNSHQVQLHRFKRRKTHQQKSGLAVLITNKVDFIANKMYIITSVHQEYIKILSVCAQTNTVLKYMKQKLIELKREIDKYTVGDLNASLPATDRNY